jgi:hypothetical protein
MADDQTIEELTRAIQALQREMKTNKTVDPKEVDRLDKALQKISKGSKAQTDAQKMQTDATDKNTKGTVRFASAVGGTVRNIGNFGDKLASAATDVQNNQESFSSLNQSIDIAAGLLKTTGKVVGGVGDSFGEALKGIPVIGGIIGGFVSAASKATAALAEATADVAAQIGKQVTSQLDNASSAFRMVAQSGALGADGMTSLANQAIGAGISFKDFADVTKNSSEGLAFAFGTATTGVDRFANISKAMTPFRRELEAMGIGAKQQNEMTANYLKLQARTARVDQMSSAELAQGSANYAKELSTLARLTGVSVDEAEKELQGQLRNARFNGAVQDLNERIGQKAGRNVELAAAQLTKQNEAIGKGFQDIMAGNALTDEAQGFILAAGERGQQAVAALQKGQISAAEATAEINRGMKDRVEAMGGPGALAKIVGAGTAFDTIALGMLEANKRVVPTTAEIAKMGEMTKKSLDPQDAATQGLIDGQMAMRNFATEVNKITNSALPTMGTAATAVADGMTAAMVEINKMISMGPEKYLQSKMGITDVDMKVVDAQDARNQEKQTGGQKFLSSINSLSEDFTGLFSEAKAAQMKADRIARETGILKARGGVDIGDKYQKQFGTQVDASASNTKKSDEMRALIRSNQYGGSLGSGRVGIAGMNGNIVPNAGPAGGYSGMDLGGSVSALGETGNQKDGVAQAMAGNTTNNLAEAQLNRLDAIATTMARSVNIQSELLQAAHR